MQQKPSKPGLHNKLKEDYDDRLQSLHLNTEISNQQVPSKEPLKLIQLKDSVINGFTWCLADAGLFNARKFRVNWSLRPSAFTYTQLAPVPKNTTFLNMVQLCTPQILNIGGSNFINTSNQKLKIITENLEKYLTIQLDLSEFVTKAPQASNLYSNDELRIPFLKTKIGNELIRQLSDCTDDIRNSIGNIVDFGI